jgi:uncharacterized ion transporter superfamily protein YfcC
MSKNSKQDSAEQKKKVNVPHVFTIILIIIIAAGIMTYIVPAGKYERVEVGGRNLIDPNSFHFVEQTPVTPFNWFKAIPEGMASSISIMAIIFASIGAVGMYTSTGAFQNAIARLLKKGGDKSSLILMVVFMTFFAIRGGFEGAIDSHLAFVPLTVGFALASGYDALTGVAITMVPTFVAFAVGPTNPYTVLVAQEIAGLPPFSGLTMRLIVFVIMMALTYYHIIKYAIKVKKDPSLSLVSDIDNSDLVIDIEESTKEPMPTRQKVLIFMLFATIVIIIIGALKWKWYLNEMTTAFIISGILGGIVAGYDNHKIAQIFIEKGASVYFGAMCVAIARAIQVILEKGNIIDTVIHGLSIPLRALPTTISALFMYIAQLLINFLIPSGSGQAMVTMPILAPLSDVIGITRQTAVMAFQFGDGITNLIFPTMGLIFAYIGLGRVSYDRYVKFIFPLLWKIIVLGAIFVVIAVKINYGPF